MDNKKGLVIKSTGKDYIVEDEKGQTYTCQLRGMFRMKGIKSTNPIAVGDWVLFQTENAIHGVITNILPRKNYIYRKSINLSKTIHIIAANIDAAFLVVSVVKPITPLGFIDRFLVAAESFRIPSFIFFNKNDLYTSESEEIEKQLRNIYEPLNYSCLSFSAMSGLGKDKLIDLMKNKTSLFCGQSGVGKSSIVNVIEPELQLKIGQISNYNSKGKHTTTFAQMYPLHFGGYIIDTPGIKEFGLIEYKKDEVGHYFPEILSLMQNCRFSNCTHTHEPDCAVKKALEEKKIALSRYNNYLAIINNEDVNLSAWMLK